MNLPIIVELEKPVKHGESEEINSLRFERDLVAVDLLDLAPNGWTVGDYCTIAGRLCGQPRALMTRLGIKDIVEVMRVVESFLPGGPATGDGA